MSSKLLPVARTLVGAALHIPGVTRQAALQISGLRVRYAADGGDELVGQRAPDFALDGGNTRLYEALRRPGFILLSHSREPVPDLSAWRDVVRPLRASDSAHAQLLVRPDAYIAWATQKSDPDTLRGALRRWCGAERSAGSAGVREQTQLGHSPN